MAELTPRQLQDIQGFILTGYGHHRYARYLFLQIRDAAKARRWLADVIPTLTTAKRWPEDAQGRTIKPAAVVNLAFTFQGMEAWGLSEDTLLSFPREFILGAAERGRVLGDTGDSAPETWQVGGPNNPTIHALLRISGADVASLAKAVKAQEARMETSGGVAVVQCEVGQREDLDREPFGFRDGISNPTVQGTPGHPESDRWVIRTGEFILGYLNEYELYPASPSVLASEDSDNLLPKFPDGALPNCRDLGANGSYVAYRKLEQDVEGFWRFARENTLSEEDEPDDQEVIKTASKMVGRWPSGAPMVLAPNYDEPRLRKNNEFTYESDPQGFACPVGAHLRRANPRASFVNNSAEESFREANRHRILRRAENFGKRPTDRKGRKGRDYRAVLDDGEAPAELEQHGPRGIHFFAVNADLQRQFELVQQSWLNLANFNGLYDNKDPLVGDNDGTGHMTIQRNPIRRRLEHLPRFVTVRGSAYLFLPSITALRFLASGAPARREREAPRGEAGSGKSIVDAIRSKAGAFGGILASLLSLKS